MSEDGVDLTVVIACLNAAETIGEQLAALAEQSCPVPYEVLVCDNGSTDATAQVVQDQVQRFGARLPLSLLDASATRGPGAARNVGAEKARGRWLAFCDADDVVGDGWLAAMAEALERYGFVGGRFDGTRLNKARALRSRTLDQQEGLQTSPEVLHLPHAGAGNMGIHRELFRRVAGFDPTIACLEDTDLSWRVQLELGVSLHYVHDAVVHVRLRSSRRDMFRQGQAYGAAYALLECRYGDCSARDPDEAPIAAVSSSAGRGPAALVRAWTGESPSVGRLIWQFGWHRGHRGRLEDLRGSRSANCGRRVELGPVTEIRDTE